MKEAGSKRRTARTVLGMITVYEEKKKQHGQTRDKEKKGQYTRADKASVSLFFSRSSSDGEPRRETKGKTRKEGQSERANL